MSTPRPQLDEPQRSRVESARRAWRYAIADARDVVDAEGVPGHAYGEAARELHFYLNEMLTLVDELTGGAR